MPIHTPTCELRQAPEAWLGRTPCPGAPASSMNVGAASAATTGQHAKERDQEGAAGSRGHLPPPPVDLGEVCVCVHDAFKVLRPNS